MSMMNDNDDGRTAPSRTSHCQRLLKPSILMDMIHTTAENVIHTSSLSHVVDFPMVRALISRRLHGTQVLND